MAHRLAFRGEVPPDAWPFWVLLRCPAYCRLCLFRSHRGFGCGSARSLSGSNGQNGIGSRRRSAPPIFRNRLYRPIVDYSACGDVHRRYDPASGRAALAGTAPAHLSRRGRQRPSYLLASETVRASLCCNSLRRIRVATRPSLCSPAAVSLPPRSPRRSRWKWRAYRFTATLTLAVVQPHLETPPPSPEESFSTTRQTQSPR